MRTIVLVAIALAGMSLISTSADAGTWCWTNVLGSTNCGYSSSEECLATVRELGGFCQPNPFPGTAYGTPRELESAGLGKALSARLLARRSANGTESPRSKELRSKLLKPRIDDDDAPEWTKEDFARADLYHGDKLIRRGRPPSDNPKQTLKLRIDPDVVEHFRATGPGWQTRINAALRRAAKLPMRKAE